MDIEFTPTTLIQHFRENPLVFCQKNRGIGRKLTNYFSSSRKYLENNGIRSALSSFHDNFIKSNSEINGAVLNSEEEIHKGDGILRVLERIAKMHYCFAKVFSLIAKALLFMQKYSFLSRSRKASFFDLSTRDRAAKMNLLGQPC